MNVKLTQDYALTSNELNFIVRERYIVDPTRAPGYKAPEDGSIPETREKWRDAGYYPLTSAGLTALIDSVRMRTVARSDAASLAELRDVVRAATNEMVAAINGELTLEFKVAQHLYN
ncbi:hypothetical protein PASE110613_09430 [Paenibacillus sediminis]|uniref:Uncharacterized protein n=1 Tax=Paenibacillus sediminis TaxID=664909 RepID=A0ABS4H6H9_9BACL|nr:hypothetical protein [Paenibacillus sediminis]MBP1938130.1 hypothetical protein [Paenibacillus sediminis]